MGRQDHSHDLSTQNHMRLCAPLTILAAGDQLGVLRSSGGSHLLDGARLVQLERNQEVSEAHLAGAGILVMEVDADVSAAMQRIERVRSLRPDLPQIVALESAGLPLVRTLLRAGVADVASLPLAPEELLHAAIAVLEARTASEGAVTDTAPLVAVTRALGGGGSTTLVTHLAAAFAEQGSEVCLFDLDVQFGRVVDVLGLQPKRNLTDLLEAGVRIDGEFLESVAARHSSGMAVVAAPRDIIPLESVDAEPLHNALTIARQKYDCVFVDMPSNITNWSLSVLAGASSIVMVVEQNIASLRQARRRLELFRSVDINDRAVSIVVNRVERRLFGSISLSDVEEALGRKVLKGVHADDQAVGIAQDQGLLVKQVRGKSAFATDIDKLAEALRPMLEQGSRA